MNRIILIGVLGVVLFDSIVSFLSWGPGSTSWGTLALYFGAGFAAARVGGWRAAVRAGAFVGLADSVGTATASLLRFGHVSPAFSSPSSVMLALLSTAVSLGLVGAFCGGLCDFVVWLLSTRHSPKG